MLRFAVVGDLGMPNAKLGYLARALDRYFRQHGRHDAILVCGNNFHPKGVASVRDESFNAWKETFLNYESLRVSWYMALGNHDYLGNPQAQIDFHYDKIANPNRYWHFPSRSYHFGAYITDSQDSNVPDFHADFFAIDTNGCQNSVRNLYPTAQYELHQQCLELGTKLCNSPAQWKIVFGHHPMYTQDKAHGAIAECLRETQYSYTDDCGNKVMKKGYGLEKTLATGHADCYFSAHDHILQYHYSQGVHNFGCGASGSGMKNEEGLSEECNSDIQLDWVGGAKDAGFIAVTLTRDQMQANFVGLEGEVYKEVTITKEAKPWLQHVTEQRESIQQQV